MRLSWPTSTLPVNAVIIPLQPTCSQAPPLVDHVPGAGA